LTLVIVTYSDVEESFLNHHNYEGIIEELCEVCERLNWKRPTKIQAEAIPLALKGRDVIGLAETGSGKTAAFALPIIQDLLKRPQRYFALVMTPTRELAFQIAEQFEALGTAFGLHVCVVVGGVDMMTQSISLAKKPHIIVATPGRLFEHLQETKGFTLGTLKYLVLDEADRILNMDFEDEVNKIIRVIPSERRTFLYSATMTSKVKKLQRVSLRDPIRVEVNKKYQTVDSLQQYYVFIPAQQKNAYLVYLVNEMVSKSMIIFCSSCQGSLFVTLLLRNLGFTSIPLHGQMNQTKRLGALYKFKCKERSILVATDVASRGLDIPHVDLVINYDIPTHSTHYVHRVGRTARAGRSGIAITMVTQYDVELYQKIEFAIEKKLPLYPTEEEEVLVLMERVQEAERFSKMELKELDSSIKGKRKYGQEESKQDRGDQDDTEEAPAVRRTIKRTVQNKFKKRRK